MEGQASSPHMERNQNKKNAQPSPNQPALSPHTHVKLTQPSLNGWQRHKVMSSEENNKERTINLSLLRL